MSNLNAKQISNDEPHCRSYEIYPKTKEKHLIFPITCDRAGNANPFLEISVYTLSTSLTLGDLLVLFPGDLPVLYVAIGADSMDQIKTLPVCTHVYCKSTWRCCHETVVIVVLYYFFVLFSMSYSNLLFAQGSLFLGNKIKTRYVCSPSSTARHEGDRDSNVCKCVFRGFLLEYTMIEHCPKLYRWC